MWKQFRKEAWSKEHAGELDYLSLEENLWDEAMNYLFLKAWENEMLRFKKRIDGLILDNIE